MDAADAPVPESSRVATGALTQLLHELANVTEEAQGGSWADTLAPGLVVDRYELVRELGRGGFGVVWEARDLKLRRHVAFKAVRLVQGGALHERRLVEEADLAARLGHPGIVTLFDLGRGPQGPYLVFELLRGQTLEAVLAGGPLPVPEVLRIGLDLARALAHAHRRGVVHRDLSPRNVFLCEEGQAKLLDLGLARAFGHRPVRGGTPGFMAPEQKRGAPEDERTDVFALGALLFMALTGRAPFRSDDGGAELIGSAQAPALDIPEEPGLAPLVTRMLAKDPVDRPRDGAEVERALVALRVPSGAAPSAPSGRGSVTIRHPRRRWWIGGAILAVVVAAAVAIALMTSAARTRPLVVVADVENRTADPQLDGLEDMVITSLEQSRRERVMPRSRMLELARQAGHPEPGRVDETLGRELGRRDGARALLLLQLRRLGETFILDARALDPVGADVLLAIRLQTTRKDGILGLVDELCERVRHALDEPAREIARHQLAVDQALSADLQAFAHYREGRQLLEQLRLPEAIQAFRAALARDPRFALAHYELARMPAVGDQTEAESLTHAAAALALPGRLPARERAILEAAAAQRSGRAEEAVELLRQVVHDFPDDADVRIELGALLVDLERPEEAAPVLKDALALAPRHEIAAAYATRVLGFLGRVVELGALARRCHEVAPGPATEMLLAEAALWAGAFGDAAAHAEVAAAGGDGSAVATQIVAVLRRGDAAPASFARLSPNRRAAVAAFRGKRAEALRVLAEEPLQAGPWMSLIAEERVAIASWLGDAEALHREVDALLQLPLPVVRATAAAVAWSGDASAAGRLAQHLPAGSADASLHRAVADFRSGQRPQALAALRTLVKHHVSGSALLDGYLLGSALLEEGRNEEAAVALRHFERASLPLAWLWAQARSLLLLARAEEALGHKREALEAADRLARYWSEADEDLPELAELRALRARLAP